MKRSSTQGCELFVFLERFLHDWANWQVRVADIGGTALASISSESVEIPSQCIRSSFEVFKTDISKRCVDFESDFLISSDLPPIDGETPHEPEGQDIEDEKTMESETILTVNNKNNHSNTPKKKKKRKKAVEAVATSPPDTDDVSPPLTVDNSTVLRNRLALFLEEIFTATEVLKNSTSDNLNQTTNIELNHFAHLRHLYGLMNDLPDVTEVFHTARRKIEDLESKMEEMSATNAADKQRMIQLTTANRKLQEEIEDYAREFSQLKNQDFTVRQLQEQLEKQKEGLDDLLASELEKQEANYQDSLTKIRQMHEHEIAEMQNTANKLTSLQAEQEQKKAVLEKSLLQSQQTAQLTLAARESEIRLLASEVDDLRSRLEASNTQRQRVTDSDVEHELSNQIKTLDHVVESLGQNLKEARATHDVARRKWESQVNALVESHRAQELQLKQTEERLNDVQQELERRRAAQSEVAHLQRQVREGGSEAGGDLEGTVRIKGLEKEASLLRSEKAELEQEKAVYQKRIELLSERVNDLQTLVESLENRNATIRNNSVDASKVTLDLVAIGRSIDQFKPSTIPTELVSNDTNTEDNNVALSLLEITTAQKQQLKEKLMEVEQDRDHWKCIASRESIRLSRLMEDNAILSERIPHSSNQSLKLDSSNQSSKLDALYRKFHIGDSSTPDLEVGYDDDEKRLKVLAPQPRSFDIHLPHSLRKLKNLNHIEQVIVMYGSAILSTRMTRLGLVCYLIILHLLVFISIHSNNRCSSSTI